MTNGNDMAFPATELHRDNRFQVTDWQGLTKREYFAAMALQGLIAAGGKAPLSGTAVDLADALIDALNAI